jgi:molybdopterin-containing oxidoreductase family iron-sulfur binding subunit
MVIDLDACTGCGACVVACQAENNTPVVGRDEMRRQRGMHWLRVDRHLLGGDDDPAIAFQPVTCHHCGRAPCETVCPVLATTHSSDGLNQQVYSRCVGTRYCMNNCPLKVRRFNWFDYARAGESFGPALNPEVTVRSRGVAEKCTFCVQRIQEARLVARQEGRPLQDGDVTPACAQTCPASAISFGDLNDPQSQVSRRRSSPLTYSLFEDMGLLPAVHYQAVVDRRGAGRDESDGA